MDLWVATTAVVTKRRDDVFGGAEATSDTNITIVANSDTYFMGGRGEDGPSRSPSSSGRVAANPERNSCRFCNFFKKSEV